MIITFAANCMIRAPLDGVDRPAALFISFVCVQSRLRELCFGGTSDGDVDSAITCCCCQQTANHCDIPRKS
eukprot:5227798-Pyramimonas_sp.AAC.1